MTSGTNGMPGAHDRTRQNGAGGSRARARQSRESDVEIVGSSPAILDALDIADRVAATGIPILIVGPTGTGKELFARYIHHRSERRGGIVCVDCGALPEELIESLLFGHRKGAFTGAVAHAEGLVSHADGGTLFLDELSSLPPRGQAKLLRVLETGRVRRVGGLRTRNTDFRLVATAQDDLPELVDDGRFRRDLLQRAAGAVIRLPAISERRGDVPLLARHFARSRGACLTEEAERLLSERSWPGNVRELRWAVFRAAIFQRDGRVDARAIRRALELGPGTLMSDQEDPEAVRRIRRLRAACRAHDGDPERVAEALGIGRSTLYRWLKRANLELRTFRECSA